MMRSYCNENDESVHGVKDPGRLHSSRSQNGMIAMLAPPPAMLSCQKRERPESFLRCRDFPSAS
eukprot:5821679-Ditylum_brightwellii.AAC.1